MNLKPYTPAKAYTSSQKLNIYLFSPLHPYNADGFHPGMKNRERIPQKQPKTTTAPIFPCHILNKTYLIESQ
jgi:hypothetical protein